MDRSEARALWDPVADIMRKYLPVVLLDFYGGGHNGVFEVHGENEDDWVWVGTDIDSSSAAGIPQLTNEREGVDEVYAIHFVGQDQGTLCSERVTLPLAGDPLDDYAMADGLVKATRSAFALEANRPPRDWD